MFMLFFVSATFNSVVISLLMSLAAAGGFLALLFAFVAAIYVGALSVALFVISAAAISSVIAVLITTGTGGVFFLFSMSFRQCLSHLSFGFLGLLYEHCTNSFTDYFLRPIFESQISNRN